MCREEPDAGENGKAAEEGALSGEKYIRNGEYMERGIRIRAGIRAEPVREGGGNTAGAGGSRQTGTRGAGDGFLPPIPGIWYNGTAFPRKKQSGGTSVMEEHRRNEEIKMRKILVVIDMQNDFIDGALGTREAVAIVDAVREKILSYPAENVFTTMDTHEENYMQTQEGKYLPVPHCIRGTQGWQIRPEIAELLADERTYTKPCFGSTRLAEDLKALSEEEEIELELVGLCTDICVVSNALLFKAAMPEVKVSVDAACCAGVTPEKHLAALETMRSCQVQVEHA